MLNIVVVTMNGDVKNKFVCNKTSGLTFNFETIDVHHHSCPSSYKLLDVPSRIVGLHLQFVSNKICN
jgi:hypothetical protein